MKKLILLTALTISSVAMSVVKAQTGKMAFYFTYDDAGNRIKREWNLVCPSCRTAKTDSTKMLDSLFNIAQNLEIKLPDNPTEELKFDGTIELKNIYPNPTRGNFIIQFTGLLLQGKLEVFNISGNKLDEIILNGREFQIDISLLPAGEYILRIQTNDGKSYKKKTVKI